MPLMIESNFHRPGRRDVRDFTPGDDFYQALLDAHQGLSDEQSALLNAELVLLLANHIGDLDVIGQALVLARAGLAAAAGGESPAAG